MSLGIKLSLATLLGFVLGVVLVSSLVSLEVRQERLALSALIEQNQLQQKANLKKAWQLQRKFLRTVESINNK